MKQLSLVSKDQDTGEGGQLKLSLVMMPANIHMLKFQYLRQIVLRIQRNTVLASLLENEYR